MPGASSWKLYGTTYFAANGQPECGTFVYNGTLSRWIMKSWASQDMPSLEVLGTLYPATIAGAPNFTTAVTSTAGWEFGNGESDQVKFAGKPYTEGTAPALSSCGTLPLISGNDKAGTVTLGTGSPTACTLTFNAAWSTNAPICVVSTNTASRSYRVSASSTSAITVTQDSAADSASFNYHCVGRL
jgi:hypothetical protein